MLSPNARKFVTLSRGRGRTVTVTAKLQFDVRRSASVTLQLTDVVPIG